MASIKEVTYQNGEIAIYTNEGKFDCGNTWNVTGFVPRMSAPASSKPEDNICERKFYRMR